MTVLIIEDDEKAAVLLKDELQKLPYGIQVLGMIGSVSEAIHWFNNYAMPDVIFSDIELADGTSFGIFEHCSVTAPVVFCTAYNEYALRAFENNGIDYLLKPIDVDKLKRSLEKVIQLEKHFKLTPTIYLDRMQEFLTSEQIAGKRSVLTYYKTKIIPIAIDEIPLIYVKREQVFVLSGHTHAEVKGTLDSLMLQLPVEDFFRANRQCIINRKYILNLEPVFGRKLAVTLDMSPSKPVIISKAKSKSFLLWLEGK